MKKAPSPIQSRLSKWWHLTRPHTLGASLAPMLIVLGALIREGEFSFLIYLICLLVALSAQVSSNLANDYFDFKKGADTEERIGFTRLLSTGAISSRELVALLISSLSLTAFLGGALLFLQGWTLLPIGIVVLLGALAYSAGPYPLSYKGLGDLSVVLFFGFIPILGSYYAITRSLPPFYLLILALGIGVWEANILVVNNYRDYKDDLRSHKRTLVVRMGKDSGPVLYTINALIATSTFLIGLWIEGSHIGAIVTILLTSALFGVSTLAIFKVKENQLNALLAYTAKAAVGASLIIFFTLIL